MPCWRAVCCQPFKATYPGSNRSIAGIACGVSLNFFCDYWRLLRGQHINYYCAYFIGFLVQAGSTVALLVVAGLDFRFLFVVGEQFTILCVTGVQCQWAQLTTAA